MKCNFLPIYRYQLTEEEFDKNHPW